MATVNDLRKVRRHMEADIDGKTYVIPMSCFMARPLDVNQEVDLDNYVAFLVREEFKPAMQYAVRLLAARGYAAEELRKALTRVGYQPEAARNVTNSLTDMGFLNDSLYAETFVQRHIQAGHGVRKIERDLKEKGIDRDTFLRALESCGKETLSDRAYQLALSSLSRPRSGEPRQKADQRVISMLIRRGFEYEEARDAVRRAREETVQEEEVKDRDAELEHAKALVASALQRSHDGEDPRKLARRILGMLARRGIDYETAQSAISAVLHQDQDP